MYVSIPTHMHLVPLCPVNIVNCVLHCSLIMQPGMSLLFRFQSRCILLFFPCMFLIGNIYGQTCMLYHELSTVTYVGVYFLNGRWWPQTLAGRQLAKIGDCHWIKTTNRYLYGWVRGLNCVMEDTSLFPWKKDEGDTYFYKNSYLVFLSLTDPNWIWWPQQGISHILFLCCNYLASMIARMVDTQRQLCVFPLHINCQSLRL
jgi:hypothetical protein